MTTLTEDKMLPFNSEGFDLFMQSREEPQWLTEIRQQAWQRFENSQWPTKREEEWMRTDIRLFKLEKFNLPATTAQATVNAEASGLVPVLNAGVELGGSATSCDGGSCGAAKIDQDLIDKGVIFGNISDLLAEHGDLIKKYLFQSVKGDEDRFASLHQAVWNSGTFLYVPRNVCVEKPLHTFASLSEAGSDFNHTLIVLEEGAEATVLAESMSAADTAGFHNGSIEVYVGARANLRYVNLQDWGQKIWHFAHQKAIVHQDANLQWTVGALGSRLAKVNQHVALRGKRAHCQVNGVMFTENKQHLSYHTLQHHEAAECTSDFLYKGALQDKSRTVWRGMIKVDEGAQQTDGYQRNDNLLLSETARADSIPGLEIEADDVRCTHGSTSGRVDDELIFYAQCRGFTRKEAIRAIVTGFFQQVFDRVTIESVREALGVAIARRVRDYE